MKKLLLMALAMTCLWTTTHAQVGINTTTPDATLDVVGTDSGVLIPRVALTATNVAAPITTPTTSELIYNTASAGTGVNAVTPGYYYWNGTIWVRLNAGTDATTNWSLTGNSGVNPETNFIGTVTNDPLVFKTHNVERMRILTNGNVGIGGYSTISKLTVVGGSSNNYGILSTSDNSDGYALYAVNQNTSSSTGIVGIGNNSETFYIGTYGTGIAGTASGDGYGVIGAHYNGTDGNRFGILGTPNEGIYSTFGGRNFGWMNSEIDGLYTQRDDDNYVALAHINNITNFGVFTATSGNTYNAGLFVASGETVISNSTNTTAPALDRSWNGSIFLQRTGILGTNGRIFFTAGGYNWRVNSSGSGDYSEYFKTSDRTLGVGEIVAMDPNNANGVRRARPSDVSKTVGIVSIGGTRNNDNIEGTRGDDPGYVNVGLLGQVPVLVTTENGNIKPGDPLTLSKKYRGRAVKATESCRIIGYALTHFPYVSGEQTYETDINGTDKLKLKDDHVMCYINPGWYEPADKSLGDGIEIIPSESAFDMLSRLNVELPLENPNKDLILDNPKLSSNRENMVIKTVENSTEIILENHQGELNSADTLQAE